MRYGWLERVRSARATRYVDLEVAIESADGETLVGAGGRWDRHERRYIGPCEPAAVKRFRCYRRGQQAAAAREFGRWLTAHPGRGDRDRQCLSSLVSAEWDGHGRPLQPLLEFALLGDRGGGKTELAKWMIASLLAAFPRHVVQVYSPNHTNRREFVPLTASDPDVGLVSIFGAQVLRVVGAPSPKCTLANESACVFISSKNAVSGRTGNLPIIGVIINEAQEQGPEVPGYAIPGVRNVGGCVIYTANPGAEVRSGKDAEGVAWVAKLRRGLIEDEASGGRQGRAYEIRSADADDRADGGGITQSTQAQAAAAVRRFSADRAERDMGGEFRGHRMACPTFSRALHVGDPPDIGWISRRDGRTLTEARTAEWFEYYRFGAVRVPGWRFVAGLDIDRPLMVMPLAQLLERDDGSQCLHVLLEIKVEERVDPEVHETVVIERLQRAGIGPDDVLIVADSTGNHQGAGNTFVELDDGSLRRLGRHEASSWAHFAQAGYTVVSPRRPSTPQASVGRSPYVVDSVREFNHLLMNKRFEDERYVPDERGSILISPSCSYTIECIEGVRFRQQNGQRAIGLDKSAEYNRFTHGFDALRGLTYAMLPAIRVRREGRAKMAGGGGEVKAWRGRAK